MQLSMNTKLQRDLFKAFSIINISMSLDEMSIKDGEETTGMETISNIMPLGKRKKGKNYGSK